MLFPQGSSRNLSNCLFDIYLAFVETNTSDFSWNRQRILPENVSHTMNYQYLELLLGGTIKYLCKDRWRYNTSKAKICANLYHSGLLNSDQRTKAYNYFMTKYQKFKNEYNM